MTDPIEEAEALAANLPGYVAEKVRALLDRLERAERERDEASAERDARPEITAEDADGYMRDEDSDTYHQYGPRVRVEQALRAHAAKARVM